MTSGVAKFQRKLKLNAVIITKPDYSLSQISDLQYLQNDFDFTKIVVIFLFYLSYVCLIFTFIFKFIIIGHKALIKSSGYLNFLRDCAVWLKKTTKSSNRLYFTHTPHFEKSYQQLIQKIIQEFTQLNYTRANLQQSL